MGGSKTKQAQPGPVGQGINQALPQGRFHPGVPPPRHVDGCIAVDLRNHLNRYGGVGIVPTLVSGHVSSSRKATHPAMRETRETASALP